MVIPTWEVKKKFCNNVYVKLGIIFFFCARFNLHITTLAIVFPLQVFINIFAVCFLFFWLSLKHFHLAATYVFRWCSNPI